MQWLLVFTLYMAPPTAVDWDGPWKAGMNKLSDTVYDSEAECRTDAIQTIGRIHQGMLIPIRYRCVPIESTLPKGATR